MIDLIKRWVWTHPKSDDDLFHSIVEGLPKNIGELSSDGTYVPFGSSPTCIQMLRLALLIVKPSVILEIGTNLGFGSAIMLHLSDAKVTSVDSTNREETQQCAEFLKQRFPDRFEFFKCDSCDADSVMTRRFFQMVYVDGSHDYEPVMKDIAMVRRLNIPWLLFDDFYPDHGPGVQQAIADSGLTVVCIIGSMALARWITEEDSVPE